MMPTDGRTTSGCAVASRARSRSRVARAMLRQIARMRLQKLGEPLGAAEKGPGPGAGTVAGAIKAVDGGGETPLGLLVDAKALDGQPRGLAVHAEEGDLQCHLLLQV